MSSVNGLIDTESPCFCFGQYKGLVYFFTRSLVASLLAYELVCVNLINRFDRLA